MSFFARFPLQIAAGLLLSPAMANAQNAAPVAAQKASIAQNTPAAVAGKPVPPKPKPPAPPVSKDPKEWLTRLNKIIGTKGMDPKTKADYDGLDPDSAFQIYHAIFPQIKNATVRRGIFRIAMAKTKAPDVIDRDPTRLLTVFDLAMQDPDSVLRQNALQAVTPLLMRSFQSPSEWVAWRKASAEKPLPALIRQSCDTLAADFSTADYEHKIKIFELTSRAAYQSGYTIERANGKITKRLKLTGLSAMRRKAVQDSGLFDALTMGLRGEPNDELAGRSLNFARIYRPDETQMQRIEPALRHQMEARFALSEAQIDGSLELLFSCQGDWAMPLLIKTVQNNYLTGGSRVVLRILTKAYDVRALPLLIDLLPATIGGQNAQIKAAIPELLIKPEPKAELAKRDADGWRDWWKKNRADYPEPARNLTLGPVKTGVEAVIARLENSSQQYGLDGAAMQQFQTLKTEERYRVLQAVWNLEMNVNAKSQMLQMFTQSDGDPDPKDPKHAPKGNPRLLDALYLGMTDADGDVQTMAAQIIFQKTMQTFPDTASFLLWRKRSAGRPLSELMLEGEKSFVARLAAAPDAEKGELLGKLTQGPALNNGTKIETKNGKTARVVMADGETGARRKILLDGGVITQATALMQTNDEAASSAAANFIEVFQPDDADLPKVEAGMKRVYTRWIKSPDEQYRPSYTFMLLYKSPWVGELLTQAALTSSAGYGYRNQGPMMELLQTEDKRAIPLLISMLESRPASQQFPLLQHLAKLTGVKYDAKQDMAFWRKWWDTNSAALPEEARAIKIVTPKSVKDVLLEKMASSQDGYDYALMYQFETADAETQWAVLSAGWKKFNNPQMKSYFLSVTQYLWATPNPKMKPGEADRRMMELFGLAISDPSEDVRKQVGSSLYNLALRDIPDAAAYAAWRKEIGDKPLAAVMPEETRSLLTRLQKADAKALPKLLDSMQQIDWGERRSYNYNSINDSDAPVIEQGLAGIRHKTALAMKLPDTLARLLKSDETPEINQKALLLLHSFSPDHAVFARVEPDAARILPLLAHKEKNNDYTTMSLVSAYRGKWATDLLLELAKNRYMENQFFVCYTLSSSRNVRVVPLLIAIMEDEDGENYMRYLVSNALARLTRTTANANRNGAWWRDWWNHNKAQMPLEARNEPIPDLQIGNRYAKTFSIKRGRQLVTVGHDAHRAYWRLSSGLLISEKTKKKAKPGDKAAQKANVKDTKKSAASVAEGIPVAERPGLLVVLGNGDTDVALQAGYWQDVAGRGFGGKYLVALVSPPKWREKQTALWLTRKNHAEVPEATFTTETLVADVARDMESKYPINPARVFLLGSGAGGQAAYACSLEPTTPFRGFLLMESTFKSSQLPPLANAKNRRYYLLHSHEDKRTPFFAATLAQNTLRTQGATVKLSGATSNPDAEQQATWEEAAEGIKWLEAVR